MKFFKKKEDMPTTQNVLRMENEFVQTQSIKNKMQLDIQKKKRRRVGFILLVAMLVMIPTLKGVYRNIQSITKMDEEIETATKEQEKLKEHHQDLNVTVGLLKDDEYIAKLARGKYYLSKDGEIIFSMPEDNPNKDEE